MMIGVVQDMSIGDELFYHVVFRWYSQEMRGGAADEREARVGPFDQHQVKQLFQGAGMLGGCK